MAEACNETRPGVRLSQSDLAATSFWAGVFSTVRPDALPAGWPFTGWCLLMRLVQGFGSALEESAGVRRYLAAPTDLA